jgi:hypothetical protein
MAKDMQRARALATKRAEEAETAALVRSEDNAGQLAQRRDFDAYMEFLALNDALSEPQRRLLAALSLSGLPSRACFEVGIPPRTYYQWCSDSPEFKAQCDDAKLFSADRLERVAIDLATGVYSKPLVSQGKLVAYEQIRDTKALIALLKARKPKEFAQRIDVTSNGHSLVKLIDREAWDAV